MSMNDWPSISKKNSAALASICRASKSEPLDDTPLLVRKPDPGEVKTFYHSIRWMPMVRE